MKISLPDVNVLLALMTARHQHQPAALGWMSQREPASVAICRVTQMGLLRLLTNPKALPEGAFTMARAWQLINEALSDRRIFFAAEPPRIEAIWQSLSTMEGVGPSIWTDAIQFDERSAADPDSLAQTKSCGPSTYRCGGVGATLQVQWIGKQ